MLELEFRIKFFAVGLIELRWLLITVPNLFSKVITILLTSFNAVCVSVLFVLNKLLALMYICIYFFFFEEVFKFFLLWVQNTVDRNTLKQIFFCFSFFLFKMFGLGLEFYFYRPTYSTTFYSLCHHFQIYIEYVNKIFSPIIKTFQDFISRELFFSKKNFSYYEFQENKKKKGKGNKRIMSFSVTKIYKKMYCLHSNFLKFVNKKLFKCIALHL